MLFQMSVWYSFFLGDLAFLSEMDKQSKGGNIVVNEKKTDRLYYVYRLLAVLLFVILFLPAANPARICGLINRSTSLLTSGFSYGTLIANFGRAFKKGWVFHQLKTEKDLRGFAAYKKYKPGWVAHQLAQRNG